MFSHGKLRAEEEAVQVAGEEGPNDLLSAWAQADQPFSVVMLGLVCPGPVEPHLAARIQVTSPHHDDLSGPHARELVTNGIFHHETRTYHTNRPVSPYPILLK